MRALAILLPVVVLSLNAQPATPNDRLVRIEENTIVLKDTLKKTDTSLDALQKDVRALQDRVIAVDSQNKIIISIAAVAFSLGLAFLIWLYKKLEALQKEGFAASDRKLLEAMADKVLGAQSRSAGASSSDAVSG